MIFTLENVLIIAYCITIPSVLFIDYMIFKEDKEINLSAICLFAVTILLAPWVVLLFLVFSLVGLVQTHGERIFLRPLFKNPFYKRS